MSKKPVIFLAFANDRVDDTAYLRNLPKELDGIRKTLAQAQQAGLCEVVERSNLTIEQLLDIFQSPQYKDRIAIFHYGGHANGYQLLLEAHDGTHASAHSEGLVSFLAKQNSLKLVFLNGCSSQQQAAGLISAGLPAVIGTSQSINDDIATDLAIRFYSALGGGSALEKAWEEAVDEIRIKKGTANMRDLFWDGMEEVAPEETQASEIRDVFPWEIHFKEGSELTRKWNLPESVDNPLFGLPPIPPKFHLPETPFRYLQRYKREQAEVFFGRSYYIRELYNLITDLKSAPLILLYGQSGVGKSSLLDAGVKPRLEETHLVWYLRRDQGLSVPNLFESATDLKNQLLSIHQTNAQSEEKQEKIEDSPKENAPELEHFYSQLETLSASYGGKLPPEIGEMFERMKVEMYAGKSAFEKKEQLKRPSKALGEIDMSHIDDLPLIDQWRLIEEVTGKPLIVIVDQLETIFTVPDPEHPEELDEFAKDIEAMFSNPEQLPKGKLILSYRKEYHPEIDEKFKQYEIPRSRLFVKHLSKKGIAEVVTGLTSSARTREKYKLEVEKELPYIIADDLLEDKESPIAPVLQILLTKMWQMAEEEDTGTKRSSVAKYQNLRQEGILMDDFYEQQIEKVHEWKPSVVESGLALDLMMFHSSNMMTADVRSDDELFAEYGEKTALVKELMGKLMELYLLSGVNQGDLQLTTLAHDTLAPIVYKQYRYSDYPGQRARRILENKVPNFIPSDLKTSLDAADLEIVETGYFGMRTWTEAENELVAASRKRRQKSQAMRKTRRRLAILAVILICIAGGVASFQAYRAERKNALISEQKDTIEEEKKVAEKAQAEAEIKKSEAEASERKALAALNEAYTARKEAEAARIEAEKQEALAVKNEADAITNLALAERRRTIADSLAGVAKQKTEIAILEQEKALKAAEAEKVAKNRADGLRIIAESKELALKAIQITNNPLENELSGLMAYKSYLDVQNFGSESNKQDRDIYNALRVAWEKTPESHNQITTGLGEIQSLEFNPQNNWLASGGTSGQIKLWKDLNDSKPHKFNFCYNNSCVTKHISFSPNGKMMASAHEDATVRVWDIEKIINADSKISLSKGSRELYGHKGIVKAVHFFSETELVSIDVEGNVFFWDLKRDDGKPTSKQKINSRITQTTQHISDGSLLIASEDGVIRRLDPSTKQVTEWLSTGEGKITSISINPSGKWVAFGNSKGKLRLISYDRSINIAYNIHKSTISSIAFSTKNSFLATASFDKTVKVFNLSGLLSEGGDKPIIEITDKEWLHTVSFSADEQHILYGGADQTIHVYDTSIETIALKLRKYLEANTKDTEKRALLLKELEALLKNRADHTDILDMKNSKQE